MPHAHPLIASTLNTRFFRLLAFSLGLSASSLNAATSISQYGITWTFDKDYPSGQFCTGDYWVVGPVKVIGITTNLHAPGFTPESGEDGSMVNPVTTGKQGYDSRIIILKKWPTYDASLNVAASPITRDHPLTLNVNSSLVSMVSWLYRSETDTEPGTPKFNGITNGPRPYTRSGAVLTVLSAPAPEGSFRPPYCGTDKTIKFNVAKLDRTKLKNLAPVARTPDANAVEKQFQRPWIDHVNECFGAMVHPLDNMPYYGREMATAIGEAALLLNLDYSQLPGHPSKDKLLIGFVQLGIDLAGIADNGGYWPANGGHCMGRKWPILFAGLMLNDQHMAEVGKWKTRFQEDDQTFYVSKAEVDITHSPQWAPDKRSVLTPYETADIGMPEWGVTHTAKPGSDNREKNCPYREVNFGVNPGYVLAARIMGQEEAWNHKALFDYTDRAMKEWNCKGQAPSNSAPEFFMNMWKQYNATYSTAVKKTP